MFVFEEWNLFTALLCTEGLTGLCQSYRKEIPFCHSIVNLSSDFFLKKHDNAHHSVKDDLALHGAYM